MGAVLALEKTLATVEADSSTGFEGLRAAERSFRGVVTYGRHHVSVLHPAWSERWTRRTSGPVGGPPPLRAGQHHFGRLDEQAVREACDLLRSRAGRLPGRPVVTLTLYLEAKTVSAGEITVGQTAVFFTITASGLAGEDSPSFFTGGPFQPETVRQALARLETWLALPPARPGAAIRRLLRRASTVLGPQALGTVWHETVHQLEWDRCHRQDVIGQEICRLGGLQVVESPDRPTFGWNAVTDEGLPALEQVLVNGGLVTGVLDSWAFRRNQGTAGYTGLGGGVPVPRTVNLSVFCPGRATAADVLAGRAVVVENLAASFPGRRPPGVRLADAGLHLRRLDAVVVDDGVPVARLARPVAQDIRLRDLDDANCLATVEQGGGEAGFCLKAGQLVRSTQTAPWLLVLGGALGDVLGRALGG